MPPVPAGYAVVRRLPSRRRAIYEALEHDPAGRRVALNVSLAPRLDPDDPACPLGWSAVDEIARIAEVVRRLDHPGIVRLVADHRDAPHPAFALAWCEGRRLDEDVVAALAPEDRLDIAIQAADLVAHAHDRAVILRDLKPGNLLVSRGPRITLIDLDLAVHGPAGGGPAGTWRWTAPEQAVLEGRDIDQRADLYALGTLLHFLVTGRALWSEGRAAVAEQLRDAGPNQHDVPEFYRPLLNGLIQADPARRIGSASDVLRELRGLRAGAAPRRWPLPLTRSPPWLQPPELDEQHGPGDRIAAAEARLAAHDLAMAAAHAEAALALAPASPEALLCLASVRLAAGQRSAGHELLDLLVRALPADAADPLQRRVIARLVSAFRPVDALAVATRRGGADLLDDLAGLLREWLHHVTYGLSHDERAAQAVRQPQACDAHGITAVLAATIRLRSRVAPASPHAAALPRCLARLGDGPVGEREVARVLDAVARAGRDGVAGSPPRHASPASEPGHAARLPATAPRIAGEAAPTTVEDAVAVAERLLAAGELEAAGTLLGRWMVANDRTRQSAALWLAAARVMIEAGQWREARDAAARALELAAGGPPELVFDASLQLALACLRLDDLDRAVAHAERCVGLRRDAEVAWDIALAAQQRRGDPGDPVARATAAVAACPGSARLHRRLALAAWHAGQLDPALVSARRALALAPDDPRCWQTRGALLLADGRAAQALRLADAFDLACDPGPHSAEIRLHAWLMLDEPRRALAAGHAVLAAHAEQASTWESLALAWLALGLPDEALNAALVVERLPIAPARAARLPCLVAFAQPVTLDEIRGAARDAALLAPGDPDAAFLHAVTLLAAEEDDMARTWLRDLVGRDPGYAPDLAVQIALAAAPPALRLAGTLCAVALGPVTAARARRAHRLASWAVPGSRSDAADV
jgi:tetratricopeptide (TPR) repeat protein